MAKKVETKKEEVKDGAVEKKVEAKISNKKKIASGILYVESNFNNTKITLTDNSGNVLMWSSR